METCMPWNGDSISRQKAVPAASFYHEEPAYGLFVDLFESGLPRWRISSSEDETRYVCRYRSLSCLTPETQTH